MKTIQQVSIEELRPEGLEINVEGSRQSLIALPRVFSTGSVGYQASGKLIHQGLAYQVSINLVVIGSKPMTKKK